MSRRTRSSSSDDDDGVVVDETCERLAVASIMSTLSTAAARYTTETMVNIRSKSSSVYATVSSIVIRFHRTASALGDRGSLPLRQSSAVF